MKLSGRVGRLEQQPDLEMAAELAAEFGRPVNKVLADLQETKQRLRRLRARFGDDTNAIFEEMAKAYGLTVDDLWREAKAIIAQDEQRERCRA